MCESNVTTMLADSFHSIFITLEPIWSLPRLVIHPVFHLVLQEWGVTELLLIPGIPMCSWAMVTWKYSLLC